MGTVLEWIASYVVPAMLAVLTPVILAGVTKLVAFLKGRIPKAAYPTVAPILGALLEFISGIQVIPGLPPGVSGMILGAVGTWLRELVDQWRKAVDPNYYSKVGL